VVTGNPSPDYFRLVPKNTHRTPSHTTIFLSCAKMSLHTCTTRNIHHCKRMTKRETERQEMMSIVKGGVEVSEN